MIEENLVIESRGGLELALSAMIARRLSCLGPTRVWLFRLDGEGLEWGCSGPPSMKLVRELIRLEVPRLGIVKVRADGPQEETAIGEIEHIVECPDPREHGACWYPDAGPRGPWPNIPLHGFGNPSTTNYWNMNYKDHGFRNTGHTMFS